MEEESKALIVGESNPYGADPYYALYPSPDGCTGERLCRLILRLAADEYLDRFDRDNLCDGPWSMKAARVKGEKLWNESVEMKRPAIILLGRKVADAFFKGIREVPGPFSVTTNCTDTDIVCLPHPSGLCRAWQIPGAFDKAHDLIAGLGLLAPRERRVFTNCNVCGRKLHHDFEDKMGMCVTCGDE